MLSVLDRSILGALLADEWRNLWLDGRSEVSSHQTKIRQGMWGWDKRARIYVEQKTGSNIQMVMGRGRYGGTLGIGNEAFIFETNPSFLAPRIQS